MSASNTLVRDQVEEWEDMPDEPTLGEIQRHLTAVEKRWAEDTREIKAGLTNQAAALDRFSDAVTTRLTEMQLGMPNQFIPRRDFEKFRDDLKEDFGNIDKRLNNMDQRLRDIEGKGWLIALGMLAGAVSVVLWAVNLILTLPRPTIPPGPVP